MIFYNYFSGPAVVMIPFQKMTTDRLVSNWCECISECGITIKVMSDCRFIYPFYIQKIYLFDISSLVDEQDFNIIFRNMGFKKKT